MMTVAVPMLAIFELGNEPASHALRTTIGGVVCVQTEIFKRVATNKAAEIMSAHAPTSIPR